MKIVSRWIVCLLGLSLFPAVFSACDDGQEEFPGDSVLRKKEIYDPGCTGKPSYCRLYYYDEKGDFLWASFDHNCNDIRDEKEHCCESSTGWDEVVKMNAVGEDLYSNPDPFRFFTGVFPASAEDPNPWEYNLPSQWKHIHDTCAGTIEEGEEESTVVYSNCAQNSNDCTLYTKNEDGRIVSYGKDDDCDGTLDFDCMLWTYNEAGRVLSETTDTDCDGEPDEDCREWSYNEFHQPIEYGRSEFCTGTWDHNCKEWHYDEQGRQTHYKRSIECGFWYADWAFWKYDEHGNLVKSDSTYEDAICEIWEWNQDGNLLEYHQEFGCDDDIPSMCRILNYNERGQIAEYRRENGCDGVGDVCKTYTYKEKYEEKQ